MHSQHQPKWGTRLRNETQLFCGWPGLPGLVPRPSLPPRSPHPAVARRSCRECRVWWAAGHAPCPAANRINGLKAGDWSLVTSTPFHLILRSQRGEKWPDVRSLSDLRLFYCGIEETGQLSRSISLNRPNYSPRSSAKSASVPQSLATNAQAGQAPRRASAGIASSISSSRNNAAGCFSPRPEGAPQTRPGGVTALGNRDPIPCAVPCLGAFGGALRS